VEQLKRNLELKEVPMGANLQLLTPYDEGIYYKAQEVDPVRDANREVHENDQS
jgi:hypothetical protein